MRILIIITHTKGIHYSWSVIRKIFTRLIYLDTLITMLLTPMFGIAIKSK